MTIQTIPTQPASAHATGPVASPATEQVAPTAVPVARPDRQGDVLVRPLAPIADTTDYTRPRSGLEPEGFIRITRPDGLFGRVGANTHVLVPLGGWVGIRLLNRPRQRVYTVLVPEGSTARLEHRGPTAHHRPLLLDPGTYELAGKVGAVHTIHD